MTPDCDWMPAITELTEKLFDNELSADEQGTLNQLLSQGPQQRSYYLSYSNLLIALERKSRAPTPPAAFPLDDALADHTLLPSVASVASIGHDRPAEFVLPSAPAPLGFLGNTIHGTVGYFSSGWPVAYLVATVILGVGLLVGAFVHVSTPVQVVYKSTSRPSPLAPSPSSQPFIGRITGMVDCEWSDPTTEAFNGANVPLGRKYALASGLMEITYDSGAKVILQGPVTYDVESAVGGYLSLGKLTAKLEKTSETANQKSEIQNQKLFAVRTPTAIVTDLGTEFGVSVDRDGNNEIEVLQGEVKVQVPTAANSQPREMRLSVGRSVRVNAVEKTITDCKANPTRFVRSLTYAASQVISVNFTHGDKSNLDPTDRTGVLNATNWNNVDGSPNPAPTLELHDAAGKPTGAKLTWEWSGSVTSPTWTNDDHMLDSRGRLFHGCFSGGTGRASLKIVVSNIPYAHYRVYVYYWQTPTKDPAHLNTFGLSLNGSEPTIISRPRTPLYHFSRYQNETASGDYQVFDGLSGDLSVLATPIGPGKYHELTICGMQIVEIPGGE